MSAASKAEGSSGRRRKASIDLPAAKRLKRVLEQNFSAVVPPISVLETFCDHQPSNQFAQSLREVPLRQLRGLMAAQDGTLIANAIRGRRTDFVGSQMVAQLGEGVSPRMTVGYRLDDDDGFALEVRLQHADVRSLLYAQTLVSEHIGEGVPIGIINKVAGHASVVHPAALNNDPLTLGSSVACADGGPGTLGLFVHAGKTAGFLSCSHVLSKCGNVKAGADVRHPAPTDSLETAVIGTLRKFIDLRGDGPKAMDAAFAEFAPKVRNSGNRIPSGYDWPSEGTDLGEPVVGNLDRPRPAVAKIGRSSGYTTGVVALENVGPIDIYMSELNCNVAVEGLIEVHWNGINEPFSKLGDSGSVVYLQDGLKPIGIVVAGGIATIEKAKVGVSYVCPIGPIMQAWDLRLS